MAGALTKLLLRLRKLNTADALEVNKLTAEAMLYIVSILRLGESQAAQHPRDDDAVDRMVTCLKVGFCNIICRHGTGPGQKLQCHAQHVHVYACVTNSISVLSNVQRVRGISTQTCACVVITNKLLEDCSNTSCSNNAFVCKSGLQSHDLPVMVLCFALAISGATRTACIAAKFCLPPESATCCKTGAAAEVVHCLLVSSFQLNPASICLLTQLINCHVKPRMLLCNRNDLACYHAMWALRQTCSSVPVFNTVAAHSTCFLQLQGGCNCLGHTSGREQQQA